MDFWLAEPDPPSKNGIQMGGPGSDLMRHYRGSLRGALVFVKRRKCDLIMKSAILIQWDLPEARGKHREASTALGVSA